MPSGLILENKSRRIGFAVRLF